MRRSRFSEEQMAALVSKSESLDLAVAKLAT